VRVVYALHQQTICTLKLVDDDLGEIGEADARVLVVHKLGQLGDALGICLRLELEALALEKSLELLVVGNDTIVDNGELPVRVGAKG
jgi:hypothetical protein